MPKRLAQTWEEKCDKCSNPAICHTEDGADLCGDHSGDLCFCYDCQAPMAFATSVFISRNNSYCFDCFSVLEEIEGGESKSIMCECGETASERMFVGGKRVCSTCFYGAPMGQTISIDVSKKQEETGKEEEVKKNKTSTACSRCSSPSRKLKRVKDSYGTRWMCQKCIGQIKAATEQTANVPWYEKKASDAKQSNEMRCECGNLVDPEECKPGRRIMCDECFCLEWGIELDGFDEIAAPKYEPTRLCEIKIKVDTPTHRGKFNDRHKAKKPEEAASQAKTETVVIAKVDEAPFDGTKPEEKKVPVKADAIHGWFVFLKDHESGPIIEFRGRWACLPAIHYDPENPPERCVIRDFATRSMADRMEKKN